MTAKLHPKAITPEEMKDKCQEALDDDFKGNMAEFARSIAVSPSMIKASCNDYPHTTPKPSVTETLGYKKVEIVVFIPDDVEIKDILNSSLGVRVPNYSNVRRNALGWSKRS